MTLQSPQIEAIILKGGLDQVTPTMTLSNGAVRQALNFECSISGGYTRIAGYERFDGHAAPSDTSDTCMHRYISVASLASTPALGSTVTNGTVTGILAYIDGTTLVLAEMSGDFAVGNVLTVGGVTVGTVNNLYAGPVSPAQAAHAKNAVADIYRSIIAAVPGSGPVRGVVEFNDVVYAFRDNAAATALDIYKSTTSGWSKVALYYTVSFTGGGATAPADGTTLTKGGVTAVIKRVVQTSGSWTGNTAAGQFIIAAPAGGNFSSGAATIGAVNVTLSGAQTQLALLPGGRFEFDTHNFAGQAATTRIYGCDGVNKAFEFDGDVLVPITTGAAVDKPTHLSAHRNYLFVSLGSSILYSAPGLPYNWTALAGAGEIATGDTVSGIISMPGGTTGSTLGVFSRNNTYILYGTGPSDFNFISYNTGSGAIAYSLQNMAQTFAFDDRGAQAIQTALQYGNFNQTCVTSVVQPFVNAKINKLVASTLCRRKSQYRAFFNDGSGLYITIVNGTMMGCMPVNFPDPVSCTYEGKKNDGTDIMYFGSTNGMVYQMDKGTSFDGADIDFHFITNYSNAKMPRTLKRYRKASIELTSENDCYANFDFSTSLGYDAQEYSQPVTETYDKYTANSRWDSFTWDSFFWDSHGIEPVECALDGTAENIALVVSGSSDYVPPFTVNSVMVHYSPRRLMR